LEAAALAAHLHGRAGARMPTYGSATDLLSILSRTLHD
jgi:NAD(P)H-hydrate repair Nnr-like enzyme with NAD(P)H-hydrate dehydratase domain